MAALVASACSTGGPTTGDPSTTRATVDPPSAETSTTLPPGELTVDPIDEHLDERGALTFDGALALFAATFAPLPDIEPASQPAVDADTAIIDVLQARRSDLTAAQREILDAVIGTALPRVAPPGDASGLLHRPRGERADLARPIIDEAVGYFSARLGRTLAVPVELLELPLIGPGGVRHFSDIGNAAAATPYYEAGTGAYLECVIRLNTDAVYQAAMFRSQISHEVFHCFQNAALGVDSSVPLWVKEGQAAWAGEEFAGGTSQSATWWGRWINEPHRPISRRSYDAIGLYSLLAAVGADPYTVIDPLLDNPDLALVRSAGGARLDHVWGLHYANEPSWGDAYTVQGPAAPSTQAFRHRVFMAEGGGTVRFSVRPPLPDEGAQVYDLTVSGDVITVRADGGRGGVRFDDGTEVRFDVTAQAELCLRPEGCECPSGSSVATPLASPDAFVAIGPGPTPTISGQSLDEWCDEPADTTAPPATDPPSECHVGTWESTTLTFPSIPGLDAEFAGGDGIVAEFRADGTARVNYDLMTPATAVPVGAGAPPIVVTVTFLGVLDGRWAAVEGGTFTVTGNTAAVRVLATSALGGTESTVIDEPLSGLVGPSGAVYTSSTCTDELLQLTNAYPGGVMTLTFQRTD